MYVEADNESVDIFPEENQGFFTVKVGDENDFRQIMCETQPERELGLKHGAVGAEKKCHKALLEGSGLQMVIKRYLYLT
jgi:hypothetical protein